ncbi:MAG: hypothetical protein H6617_08510 [Bdellovibrionaceae bacterium]|nr:hypothetical protein [Bdellovibrionales bacterium]MCB9254709.1 hypothetical protein [Pseudobdellovibrionaceae bacterium]
MILFLVACGPVPSAREVAIEMDFPHVLEVVPERLERLTRRGARLVVHVQSPQQTAEYAFRFARAVRLRLQGAIEGAQVRLAVWDGPGKSPGPCLIGEKILGASPVERVSMHLQVPAAYLD